MNRIIRLTALGFLSIIALASHGQEANLADRVARRYSELKSLDIVGKLEMKLEENGKPREHKSEFKAWFSAPSNFSHQMDQQPLLAGNRDKAYVYYEDKNAFIASDVAAEPGVFDKLPSAQRQILAEQNPSLSLAMSKDPQAMLTSLLGADIKTQGATLTGAVKRGDLQLDASMEIDPQTLMIKKYEVDLTKYMAANGRADLKNVKLAVVYDQSTPDAAKNFAAFAPPGNARRVESTVQLAEGKPAPDFALQDLDGNRVTLAEFKGKVVVLDFWATWCGPCRAEMPELNRLYQAFKDKDLVVLALNNQEDKAAVSKFMKDNKLEFPALLDSDGKVAEKYNVEGFPTTVLIDPKGLVRSTDVGFSGSLAELEKKITELMKKG